VKRLGTINDEQDPAYQLAKDRSIAYGKGAGGGGGKYVFK